MEFNSQSTIEFPYPGLRSFQKDERIIFFGRDDQTSAMIERLAAGHFLCITGPSGCGKSSLGRTGLMNALEAGFLDGTGSDWCFVDFAPGSSPIHNMIEAIGKATGDEAILSDPDMVDLFYNRVLTSPQQLPRTLRALGGFETRPTLIFVDQFEELFRFAQKTRNEATAFVEGLLSVVAERANIYVALTCRIEALEHFSQFDGLPNAITDGLFLTPLMSRYELEQAIEGPAAIAGGMIVRKFSIWLLNQMDRRVDQLPLMQHALKTLWDEKRNELQASPALTQADFDARFRPLGPIPSAGKLRPRDMLEEAMSTHLDEIYNTLDASLRPVARRIFCALSDPHTHRTDLRAPKRIEELAAIAAVPPTTICSVVEPFRREGADFIVPPPGEPLVPETVIDIRHEAILRRWKNLSNEWLPEERKAGNEIRYYARAAERGLSGPEELLREREARKAGRWRREFRPNAAWAERHLAAIEWHVPEDADDEKPTYRKLAPNEVFDRTDEYIGRSAKAEERKRRSRGLLRTGLVIGFVAMPLLYLVGQRPLHYRLNVQPIMAELRDDGFVEPILEDSARALLAGREALAASTESWDSVEVASVVAPLTALSDAQDLPSLIMALREADFGCAVPSALSGPAEERLSICRVNPDREYQSDFENEAAKALFKRGNDMRLRGIGDEALPNFAAAEAIEQDTARFVRHVALSYLSNRSLPSTQSRAAAWECFSAALGRACRVRDYGWNYYYSIKNTSNFINDHGVTLGLPDAAAGTGVDAKDIAAAYLAAGAEVLSERYQRIYNAGMLLADDEMGPSEGEDAQEADDSSDSSDVSSDVFNYRWSRRMQMTRRIARMKGEAAQQIYENRNCFLTEGTDCKIAATLYWEADEWWRRLADNFSPDMFDDNKPEFLRDSMTTLAYSLRLAAETWHEDSMFRRVIEANDAVANARYADYAARAVALREPQDYTGETEVAGRPNYFAAAIRTSCLAGRTTQAQEAAEQLRSVDSSTYLTLLRENQVCLTSPETGQITVPPIVEPASHREPQ